MAWLQKRPQVSDPVNYYSVGLNKVVLIVGLGNPGKEYELTRHNIGFLCVDEFVLKSEEMSQWIEKKDLKCLISSGQLGDSRVHIIKPSTYMNNSGQSVELVARFYNIHPDNVIVVHDELDIDFGQIRVRKGGTSAGHNGIKSISKAIGQDYYRIRIGIGPKVPVNIDSQDFVLGRFTSKEKAQLVNLKKEVVSIISEHIFGGNLEHETRTFLV